MVKTVKVKNHSGNNWFKIVPQVKRSVQDIGLWFDKIVAIKIENGYLHIEVSE